MRYYRNELGHVVSVEDRMWETMKKIHPYVIDNEVEEEKKPQEDPKTIDKLNTLNDDNSNDSGARPKPKTAQKRATKKGNAKVLGTTAKKQGRPKAVQTGRKSQTKK